MKYSAAQQFDALILMPPHAPENFPRFTDRYSGLSEQLTKREVGHGFVFGHGSFDGSDFTGVYSAAMTNVAIDGMASTVRDLTMTLKAQPLYQYAQQPGTALTLIHTPRLNAVLADKGRMYDLVPTVFPKTAVVQSPGDIEAALDSIPGGSVVVKPATGMASKDVSVAAKTDAARHRLGKGKWLIQEFIDSTVGIPELGVRGNHNLRTILIGGEVIGAVVRQAALDEPIVKNDTYGSAFRPELLPDTVHTRAQRVIASLESEFPEARRTVLAMDLAYGRRGDGSEGYSVIEINRRPLRLGAETTRRINPDTGELVCPPRFAKGVTELGRRWDAAEAEMIAGSLNKSTRKAKYS